MAETVLLPSTMPFPYTLAAGAKVNVFVGPFTRLRIKGATGTVSEINDPQASAHSADLVTTDALGTGYVVTWPYVRIEAGASPVVIGPT